MSKRPIRRNVHKRNHVDHVWPCGILLKNKKVAGLCWPKGDTMGVAEDVAQALQSLFALVAGYEWKTLEDTGSRFCTLCALFVHSLLLWLILSCLSVSFRLSYCLFLCRGRLSLICTGSCSCELSSCETGRSIVSGCWSLWLSYTNTLLQDVAGNCPRSCVDFKLFRTIQGLHNGHVAGQLIEHASARLCNHATRLPISAYSRQTGFCLGDQ